MSFLFWSVAEFFLLLECGKQARLAAREISGRWGRPALSAPLVAGRGRDRREADSEVLVAVRPVRARTGLSAILNSLGFRPVTD